MGSTDARRTNILTVSGPNSKQPQATSADMTMRYGDAIERDYTEIQSLRRQLAQAQALAVEVQAQLKDREKTILHLQRQVRAKIFTHLADLTPGDLTVPDDMFPEADASGLYHLNREQIVHLLLKKEMTIRGLVRRVWATKLERDQWMLRAHRAQKVRGKPTTGPPVRGYYSEIQQWMFADRSCEGVERVEERMDRAIHHMAREQNDTRWASGGGYTMKERLDNWTRDPVDLGPLVDLGGNGYYGRRPELGSGLTGKQMMDDEDNSVLWNVSDDEDKDAATLGTKGKNHKKTPDPLEAVEKVRTRPEEQANWCEKQYVFTALASTFGVDRLDSRTGGTNHDWGEREKEPSADVDPSFWLPDGAASTASQTASAVPQPLKDGPYRRLDAPKQAQKHRIDGEQGNSRTKTQQRTGAEALFHDQKAEIIGAGGLRLRHKPIPCVNGMTAE